MTLTHHSPSLWVQCSAIGRKLTAPGFLAERERENWTIHVQYFDFSQGKIKGLAYVLLEWKCWKENTKLGSAESNPRFRLSCTRSPMPLLFAQCGTNGRGFLLALPEEWKSWSMHPVFQLFRGIVSVLLILECYGIWHILRVWGALRTRESWVACCCSRRPTIQQTQSSAAQQHLLWERVRVGDNSKAYV